MKPRGAKIFDGSSGVSLLGPPPARDLPLHPSLPPLVQTKLAHLARRIRTGIVLE